MDDVEIFLLKHVERDIRLIGKSLGKSSDKTIVAIHLLLKHLGQVQFRKIYFIK